MQDVNINGLHRSWEETHCCKFFFNADISKTRQLTPKWSRWIKYQERMKNFYCFIWGWTFPLVATWLSSPNKSHALAPWAYLSTLLLSLPSISLSFLFLLPWIGLPNLLLLLKARSPLENSVTCLSGRISMEDLQSQRSTSMDWLSKFTGPSLHSHCRPSTSSESLLVLVFIFVPFEIEPVRQRCQNHMFVTNWSSYSSVSGFLVQKPIPETRDADIWKYDCRFVLHVS